MPAPDLQVFHYHDLKSVAWKNGGGQTREIARYPAAGDFFWRLSVATIAAQKQSPFSQYDGYDRLILPITKGQNLLLHRVDENGDLHIQRLKPFEAYVFKGEDDVKAVDVLEDSQDFNLMVRRDWGCFQYQILSFDKKNLSNVTGAGVYGFFVLSGHCAVRYGTSQRYDLTCLDTVLSAVKGAHSLPPEIVDSSGDFLALFLNVIQN